MADNIKSFTKSTKQRQKTYNAHQEEAIKLYHKKR